MRIVGFILLLFLCVLIPLGVTSPAPYTISYSGPSHIPPGGSGTFTFTVKKDGIPQSGVTMYFYHRPEDFNSELNSDRAVTDTNGEAQITLTLESGASGTYRITGTAPDREGGKQFDEDIDYVRFDVIVGSPPPPLETGGTRTTNTTSEPQSPAFSRISGHYQSGVVGQPLAKPFVVRIRRDGDPLEGVRVVFKVLTGGGSLSAKTVLTDANGRAESTLTLGSEPVTNTVQVSAEGTDQVIIFSAEASLPPPDANGPINRLR